MVELTLDGLALCDVCNVDYTNSEAIGGALIHGDAVCPECLRKYGPIASARKTKAKATFSSAKEQFREFLWRSRANKQQVFHVERRR